jgi:hypothetical protein
MSTCDWQVRDILDPKSKENKSLPSSRAAPAPYVLSVRAQVQNMQALTDASHVAISVKPKRFTVCLMMLATENPCYVFWLKAEGAWFDQSIRNDSPANGSHRQPPRAAHQQEGLAPETANPIEMSTGPNVPAQQDSFISALQVLKRDCDVICLVAITKAETPYVQSFGASLGLPVQSFGASLGLPVKGLSPEREMPSRMPGEGDSHQYAPASRISLPASKTAKGKQ